MRNVALITDMRRTLWRAVASLAVVLGMSMGWSNIVEADEWGCQVMLCLSNPGGPEQYAECEPPIERLWAALRRGDPFPVCDVDTVGMPAGSATSTLANVGDRREGWLTRGRARQSERLRRATGVLRTFGNQRYTRVGWGAGWGARGGIVLDMGRPGPTDTQCQGERSAQRACDAASSAAHLLRQADRPGRRNR
ncbi:hypothetical protein [Burkholderia territorii]|uniref:hypothetical protein n=1 Tax=Burkholderia territorii TaxID=1503055 RepID=UPI0012DA1DAD|nr:hypothetical protein [Burkholderia territorii]